MLILLIIIGVVSLGGMLFMHKAPQFGARPNGESLSIIKNSPNYQNGKFMNLVETRMNFSFSDIIKTLREFITAKNTSPSNPLIVQNGAPDNPVSLGYDPAHITWFGHSSVLVELDGKRILLDPMFGPAASPFWFFGKRFPYQHPVSLNQFSHIDAVIISHDHYDHLDYQSIINLKEKTDHFFMPLGVGAHLLRWGVQPSRITELDWWQSIQYDSLKFTATPARHFSGRTGGSRDKSLWSSWVIQNEDQRIFFSGDGGYADHFKQIGEKYGPFDVSIMECGQYNEKWEAIHMMPEQSVQAHLDLKGRILLPIHWGAFKLSVHEWTEPIERIFKASENVNAKLMTPKIGQRVALNAVPQPERWWGNGKDL